MEKYFTNIGILIVFSIIFMSMGIGLFTIGSIVICISPIVALSTKLTIKYRDSIYDK